MYSTGRSAPARDRRAREHRSPGLTSADSPAVHRGWDWTWTKRPRVQDCWKENCVGAYSSLMITVDADLEMALDRLVRDLPLRIGRLRGPAFILPVKEVRQQVA